jgi:hypothetical protein
MRESVLPVYSESHQSRSISSLSILKSERSHFLLTKHRASTPLKQASIYVLAQFIAKLRCFRCPLQTNSVCARGI